jgi:hypothetical protein
MQTAILRKLIRETLLERVVYEPVEGIPDDMGWYGASLSDPAKFEEYAQRVDILGVPVTVHIIPGREKPHARRIATYEAGSMLSADDILEDRVPIRGPEEELVDIYGGEEERTPFVNPVTGTKTKFLNAPPIPAQIPSGRERAVAEKIAQIIQQSDTRGITLIFPQRAGSERDATPGWFVHDLGHVIGLESGDFKDILRPLTRMGEAGLRALESLRAADSSATVGTAPDVAMDYGPQALVNMVFRGGGQRVVLDGAAVNNDVQNIGMRLTKEIRRRLNDRRGIVAVW